MDFKKPTRWFVAVAAAAAVLAGVCFATATAHMDAGMQSCIDEAILEYNYSASQSPERFCTQNWIALGSESRGARTTVYAWVYYGEYECDGKLELRRASHVATAITVERTEDGYELVEYWEPRDGSYLFRISVPSSRCGSGSRPWTVKHMSRVRAGPASPKRGTITGSEQGKGSRSVPSLLRRGRSTIQAGPCLCSPAGGTLWPRRGCQ